MPSIIVLTLLISSLTWAGEKYMAVMGVGGEPGNKETTIFDDELENMSGYLSRAPDTNLVLSLNGGHSKTEEIISEELERQNVKNTPFVEASFDSIIADYERKIQNGQISNGDQLILYISTHGARQIGDEKSHSIALTGGEAVNLNNLKGARTVSLDKLEKLITLAEQKGVKLGILDFSCHSGNSINLHRPNTCIISASGPDHYGYAVFGETFAARLLRGRSLEDVYLKTLESREEPSFPMISTPQGIEIQNELYKKLGYYLYSYSDDVNQDKLAERLENELANNRCEEANQDFNDLLLTISNMRSLAQSSRDRKRYDSLTRALQDYHEFLNEIKEDLSKYDLPALKKKEKFCTTRIYSSDYSSDQCQEWTLQEILRSDFQAEIDVMNNHYKDATGSTLSWKNAYTQNLEKAKARQVEFLLQNPQYAELKNFFKNRDGLKTETWSKASKVAEAFRNIYLKEYKSRTSSAPNPCRDIVL